MGYDPDIILSFDFLPVILHGTSYAAPCKIEIAAALCYLTMWMLIWPSQYPCMQELYEYECTVECLVLNALRDARWRGYESSKQVIVKPNLLF